MPSESLPPSASRPRRGRRNASPDRDMTHASEPAQTLKPQWEEASRQAEGQRSAPEARPQQPERPPANDNAAQREQPQPRNLSRDRGGYER